MFGWFVCFICQERTLGNVCHLKMILLDEYDSFFHMKEGKMCIICYYLLFSSKQTHPFLDDAVVFQCSTREVKGPTPFVSQPQLCLYQTPCWPPHSFPRSSHRSKYLTFAVWKQTKKKNHKGQLATMQKQKAILTWCCLQFAATPRHKTRNLNCFSN